MRRKGTGEEEFNHGGHGISWGNKGFIP